MIDLYIATHIRENGASSGIGVLAAYAYDNLGRVTSITRGNGVVTGFDYDAAGRLSELTQDLSGTANDQTLAFTYNAAGQIASRTMANDIYAFTGHTNQDVTLTVDGLNRFLSGGGVSYDYDTRGNMTADGVRAYAYDFDNRLTSVTGGGTGDVSLTYDPAGRLYQTAQVSGATTRFLYDGANLIGEYNAAGALLRRYVQGPGLDAPLVRYDGTGTTNRRWLITDERGSVVAETNASGAAVQINTYDEYGMPGSGNTSRFGYTGQMWIAEIGLYHYRNRVYNPRIGRFMQTDPIGQQGGINLYAYVGNDPVNHTDPWGLRGEPIADIIEIIGTRTCIVCGNEAAFSLFIGGLLQNIGQIGQDVIGQDGQEGECPEASYREGLSPIYSRFDSPEAAVNAIARSAFDYATGLGIEVGGYIVRSGSQYRLTSLIHGSATSIEFNTTNLRAAQQRGQIVGAWHVHPSGDPHFSAADGSTLNFIAGHSGVAPNPTFFAVGSDGRFGALRYRGGAPYPPRDRGVNYEADTVTRSTCGG